MTKEMWKYHHHVKIVRFSITFYIIYFITESKMQCSNDTNSD